MQPVLENEGFGTGLRAAPIRFVWLRLGQVLALYVCCVFPEAAFVKVQFRAFRYRIGIHGWT